MTKAVVVGVSLLLSSFNFCNKDRSSHPPAVQDQDFTTAHYLRRTNSDTVIVFVHGIFGGGVGTWTNSKSLNYWPKLLVDDDTFKGNDIYVYSYSTPYISQALSIDELIENMRLVLGNDEVFQKHKKVVFLCHSMGGIVVRGFLKRYPANAPQVSLVYFFSTPTAGSHITQLAKFLSNNPQLKGMLPADSENYVSNLQRDWRAMVYHVNSRCAYEKLDTYGVTIVDEQSASALCDGPVDPIEANHIDIVKPKDRSDLPYVAFKQAYLAVQQSSNNISLSSSSNPTTNLITGTVQTARSVEVDCGQVRDDTALIPPPIQLKPEQKIVDAVASLQDASNLKEQQVAAQGLVNQMAKVHYRLVGLDRPASPGTCLVKGYGDILITFIVSQPAGMQTVGFSQIQPDSLWVALAGKSGTLKIRTPQAIPPVLHATEQAKTILLLRQTDVLIKGDDHPKAAM